MKTLMDDSQTVLPGARKFGHRAWFFSMAESLRLEAVDELVVSPHVEARVDHGRWLADCPFCAGAELVTSDDPVFFCLSCGNAEVGGRMLKVIFPTSAKRSRVEKLLIARPRPNRNWNPKIETVADMRAENKAHGLES